jgi:hypothetical protein
MQCQRNVRKLLRAGAFGVVMLAGSVAPAWPAEERPPAWPAEERKSLSEAARDAAELAARAAETIIGALQGVIETLPQYEAPEVMPNGDIIIRRKPQPELDKTPKETET